MVLDVLILLGLLAVMVAIRWHAPVYTHSYAQFLQINASIDEINGGSWVVPVIEPAPSAADGVRGEPAHKPQLYAWVLSAAMLASNAKDASPHLMDLIFRTPTILAGAGLLLLVYSLGRRWYGRGPALAAGALLVTMLHMNKLVYLTTTDMLLTFWITWCIWAADRLTFHPARRRWPWAVALWAGMIFAAITKGWGIVNLAVVGGWLAFAVCFGPGLAALGQADGPAGKLILFVRLLWRRAWAMARRVRLGWGLLAMLAVSVPLWWAMLDVGGEQFRKNVHFEVVQRLTGKGEHAPGAMRGPAVAHLFYNTLPASIFAVFALSLAPMRRWRKPSGAWAWLRQVLAGVLGRRSPIVLPMWWIVTVVLAFSVPAGFRSDYLFPCYPAVALLAGWAVRELMRPDRYAQGSGKHARRIVQATPMVIGVGMAATAGLYLAVGGRVDWLPLPDGMLHGTWGILAAVPIVGLLAAGLGALSIVRRQLWLSVAGCVLGMLAVTACYSHLWSGQARTGDGEVLVNFAARAKPLIGEAAFANITPVKAGMDAYMGRFGQPVVARKDDALSRLNGLDARYAVVTDRMLLELGAYRREIQEAPVPAGAMRIKIGGQKRWFQTAPESLGQVLLQSPTGVAYEDWGRLYLIEIERPIRPKNPPVRTGYISNEAGDLDF